MIQAVRQGCQDVQHLCHMRLDLCFILASLCFETLNPGRHQDINGLALHIHGIALWPSSKIVSSRKNLFL